MPNYKVEFDHLELTEKEIFEKYPEDLLRKIESVVVNVNNKFPDSLLPLTIFLNGTLTEIGVVPPNALIPETTLLIEPDYAEKMTQTDLEAMLCHEASHMIYHEPDIKSGLIKIFSLDFSKTVTLLQDKNNAGSFILEQFGSVENFQKQTARVNDILQKYGEMVGDLSSVLIGGHKELAEKMIQSPLIQSKSEAFHSNKIQQDIDYITNYIGKLSNPPQNVKGGNLASPVIDDMLKLFTDNVAGFNQTVTASVSIFEKLGRAWEYRADVTAAKMVGAAALSKALNATAEISANDEWADEKDRENEKQKMNGNGVHASVKDRIDFAETMINKLKNQPDHNNQQIQFLTKEPQKLSL